MSDAQLQQGFEACVRRLVEERTRPDSGPLHVAICRPEGRGGSIFHPDLFSPLLGHNDYVPRVTCSTTPPDAYAVAYYTPRDRGFLRDERVNTLVRQAESIAEELQHLCGQLPARVMDAARLPESRDWWRTLFHLAWHFDRPFLNSNRARLLTSDGRTAMRVDETFVQQNGLGGQRDIRPGMIYGTLTHDATTASEAAVGVLLDMLRDQPASPRLVGEGVARAFARLRDRFLQGSKLHEHMPGGDDTAVKLLRYTNSFTTPPATEWAALKFGGVDASLWQLARIDADQEYCQVRGPATRQFNEWAAEAARALPAGIPAEATLFDGELRLPNGAAVLAGGPTPILSPGDVQRWLRFVFSTVRRLRPSELQITWGTAAGPTSYGMATLKQNIFAASALAIELAGLLPADRTGDAPVGVRVIELLEGYDYPAPGAGRYVRFHRGDRTSSGEPEWLVGWAWAERPEDGWVECGLCGTGSGTLVPVGQGTPPAACDWLPPEWPALFFPLGSSVDHCAGWRVLVRGVLEQEPDTIPPDDRRFGWLTMFRATRQLAHHFKVIPFDRVVAPLPASRAEARREIDPLLDGIVAAKRYVGAGVEVLAAGDPPQFGRVRPGRGRPPDGTKLKVVAYVRELRAEQTPWKGIPGAVFKRFGVRYTAETLRGYLKSG